MLFWIFPALGASISDAFHNLFIKKQTQTLDVLSVSWIRSVWIAFILLPLIFLFPSDTTKLFWIVLIIRTIFDTVATVFYVSSIKHSDISLVLPIIALTPIFIVVIEFFLFGSIPSSLGFTGICLVVFGTYLLNIKKDEIGILTPLKNLYKDRGSRAMFVVAIIWSLTSTLHTVAIRESNPYFYGGVSALFIIIPLTILMFFKKGFKRNDFKSSNVIFHNATPGVLGASAHIFQLIAQSLAPASYVIAIKRTSIVFSSILASIFLKEPLKGRLLASILSTLGVIFVAISLA